MEEVLPKGKQLDALEKFYKKYLKPLLSVPVTAADPAVSYYQRQSRSRQLYIKELLKLRVRLGTCKTGLSPHLFYN